MIQELYNKYWSECFRVYSVFPPGTPGQTHTMGYEGLGFFYCLDVVGTLKWTPSAILYVV